MKIHKSSLITKIKHHHSGFCFYREKLSEVVNNIESAVLTENDKRRVLVCIKEMREEIEQIENYVNDK